MAEPVAALIVRVAADLSELKQGVQNIDSTLQQTAQSMGRFGSVVETMGRGLLGALSIGAVISAIQKVGEWGGQIIDLSNRLGISTDAVQRFSFAAEQSGSSIDVVARAMGEMAKRLIGDDPGLVKAVDAMGLSLSGLKQLAPDQAFLTLARAVSEIENPMIRTATATAVWGRAGQEVLQILPTLAADMSRATVASEGLVSASDSMGDTWDRLKGLGSGLLAVALLPIGGWLKEIDETIISVQGAWSDLATLWSDGHLETLAQNVQIAHASVKNLQTDAIEPLAMSWEQATRIAGDLDRQIKETTRAAEAHARAIDVAAASHRQFTNWIGEREIEDVQNWQRAIVEATRAAMDAFNEHLDELTQHAAETERLLEEEERAWRDWQNELGLILMEQDRLQMEHAEAMKFTWDDALSSIGGFLDQFGHTFEGILGERFITAMSHFRDAFHEGRNVAQGILRGMSGDFSGWVDAVMAGIRLVTSAWQAIKNLFGGGEEGTQVNPARDAFLARFAGMEGDFDDPNNPPGFHGLAALLTRLTGEGGGGPLFAALTAASTMSAFTAAMDAILRLLRERGVPGFIGGTQGRFVDFGPGTMVALHGRERVMTESEGRAQDASMRGVEARLDRLAAAMAADRKDLPRELASAMMLMRGRGQAYA